MDDSIMQQRPSPASPKCVDKTKIDRHRFDPFGGGAPPGAEGAAPLPAHCEEMSKMLGGIIAKAELFCKPESLSIHEEQALYFISTGC